MDKYKVMENVANGLLAASKIQKIYASPTESTTQNSREQEVSLQTRPQLGEVLGIIADYSPPMYKSPLSSTVCKCNDYTNVYRNLKRNYSLAKTRGVSSDAIANTLAAMSPVVNNHGKVLISKVLQIYEILKS